MLAERITEISDDPNTYLIVCDENSAILATALLTLCNDVMFKRQPFAVIENVVVSKDFQRAGIGKSLVKHIETYCLQQDCSKIMLLSGTENRSAHDFYAAIGYNTEAKAGFVKYRKSFAR